MKARLIHKNTRIQNLKSQSWGTWEIKEMLNVSCWCWKFRVFVESVSACIILWCGTQLFPVISKLKLTSDLFLWYAKRYTSRLPSFTGLASEHRAECKLFVTKDSRQYALFLSLLMTCILLLYASTQKSGLSYKRLILKLRCVETQP